MTLDTIIRGGTIVNATGLVEADIAIADEKIAAVGDADTFSEATRIIDATDQMVMPGIVDPHVHVADMFSGDSYESASKAAALGGVTTFIDFGWQAWTGETSPYDSPSSLLDGIARKRAKADDVLIDYALHGGITRETEDVLDELEAAVRSGVTSFKLYTTYEMGVSYGFIDKVLEQLASLDSVAVVHTEDPTICAERTEQLQRDGRDAPTDYPDSRPAYAEAISAATVAQLAVEHDAKYYGFHTTSEKSLNELSRIQDQAGRETIRAETCTHYVALDESVYETCGNLAMIAPPIRGAEDQDALFKHLQQGTLDVVSSDHCGYTRSDKNVGSWWESAFGANGLQTELPVLHDEAINERGFSYPFLVQIKSTLPAQLFGLPDKGTITPGADADIVVFDPNLTYEISADDNVSIADFTLFEGREVTGAVRSTLVRGKPVVEDGKLVGDSGHGEFITRKRPDWTPEIVP